MNCQPNKEIKRLKVENRALKDSIKTLSDKQLIKNISKSLNQIEKGNYIVL